MRQYKDILQEISELQAHIEEADDEIETDEYLIEQEKAGLASAIGPGLSEYRQSILEEIRNLKDDIDWWLDEKEISNARLKELQAEKAKFEDPNWQQN